MNTLVYKIALKWINMDSKKYIYIFGKRAVCVYATDEAAHVSIC